MSLQDLLLGMAGQRTKARKREALKPIRDVVEAESVPSLKGVDFASNAAETLATEAGLTWQDFAGAKCSGCAGYTASDVRRIVGSKDHA